MVTLNKPEYLSEDILDEKFVKTFSLFHTLQTILGTCRVHVKDRFVTVPTVYHKLYTALLCCVTTGFYIYMVFFYFVKFSGYPLIYYLSCVSACSNVLIFFSNVFHVRFLNNKSNVKFFLKMQEIDRRLRIDQIEEINLTLYNINMCTVACFTIPFTFMFVIASTQINTQVLISSLGMFWGIYCFFVEIFYCSNLIVYFHIRVCFVNAILTNHLKPNKLVKPSQKYNVLRKKLLRLASRNHSFELSKTDIFLKEIFDGFFQYRKLYSFQIFLLSIVVVTWMLMGCQYFISLLKLNGRIEISELLMVTVTLSIYLMATATICVRIEIFHREIKRTKSLCIMVMSQYYNGALREKAKRMLAMIIENPPIFNVYDMWQLDARMLLMIFNLVTPIVVALLQFAFL